MTDQRTDSGTAYPPADLAARIELYLDDAPMYGGHSDKAGGTCWELLREAMEELRGLAQTPLAALVREWREAQKAIDEQVAIAKTRPVLMAERGLAMKRLVDAHNALIKYADEEMG